MKKMIIIFISAIALILCITPTHAIENNNYLISDINLLLQDLNFISMMKMNTMKII